MWRFLGPSIARRAVCPCLASPFLTAVVAARLAAAAEPSLCAPHLAQALAGDEAGEEIAPYLPGRFVSASELSEALGRVFSAVARGRPKRKTASTLAYPV